MSRFWRRKDGRFGVAARCGLCMAPTNDSDAKRAARAEWYQRNKDLTRERTRAWRKANPEQTRDQRRRARVKQRGWPQCACGDRAAAELLACPAYEELGGEPECRCCEQCRALCANEEASDDE